ncbi:MAG: nucleoside hydrolase [Lachnospiraceae bacterium]|nr:nucleoside hydrolase [Lachnospiraceae bacterium]
MKYEGRLFDIPEAKRIRVIIDTDAACEADDPFAIVQALLSPKLMVKGIAAEHFAQEGSMERSFEEIRTILAAMELNVPVLKGQKGPLAQDEEASEAVDFLIAEALKEENAPLFVLCQGAMTNVAMALKKCPEIAPRMTVIWIGTHGTMYEPAPFREFNAGNDIEAANFVLGSDVPLWLVPSYVYTTINIGIAEIKRRIAPCGKIGAHLYENLMAYNHSEGAGWTQGESWSLGDSPAIALAINPGCGRSEMAPAPYVEEDTTSKLLPERRRIKIYKDVDSRYILEDLIAKLELFSDREAVDPFEGFVRDIETNGWNVFGVEVYKNGVLTNRYGDTEDHLHELYSATKTILSIAVGIVYDMGLIDLNTSVLKYLPKEKVAKMSSKQKEKFEKITIQRLLTMSVAGFPFRAAGDSWLDFALACEIPNPEERVFNYSNINSYLVGVALTEILGRDLGAFIEERILKPLGIERYEYARCPEGYFYGASGMKLTVHDFSKIGLLLYNRGVYEGRRILSEKYDALATSVQMQNREGGYGYFVWKYRDGFSINGRQKQKCYVLPSKGLVITQLCNIEDTGNDLRNSMEKWLLDREETAK